MTDRDTQGPPAPLSQRLLTLNSFSSSPFSTSWPSGAQFHAQRDKPKPWMSRPGVGPTFAAGDDGDVAGPRAAVEDDGLLHPRDQEMGPFSHHHVLHPSETVEDHGSVPCVHCGGRERSSGVRQGDQSRN